MASKLLEAMEAEGSVIAEILEPVDEKYRSASSARSRRSFADVPVFAVWASWVRTSGGNCLRKTSRNKNPGSCPAGTNWSILAKH